jgi:hypothetical protein
MFLKDYLIRKQTLVKYLSMKEGSLFCFVVMSPTSLGCFRSCRWCLWKALDDEGCTGLVGSTRKGAWAWFHGVWTCHAKVLEYWMISSLKIKLNRSWKFRRNWNVHLVLFKKILFSKDLMEFIW